MLLVLILVSSMKTSPEVVIQKRKILKFHKMVNSQLLYPNCFGPFHCHLNRKGENCFANNKAIITFYNSKLKGGDVQMINAIEYLVSSRLFERSVVATNELSLSYFGTFLLRKRKTKC